MRVEGIYSSVYRNFLSPLSGLQSMHPLGPRAKSLFPMFRPIFALMNDPFVIGQCRLMGENIFQTEKQKTESVVSLLR